MGKLIIHVACVLLVPLHYICISENVPERVIQNVTGHRDYRYHTGSG